MGYTLAEKIIADRSGVDHVSPGDIVMLRCDVVLANEVAGPIAFKAMEEMGADRVFDPDAVVMVADHFVPAKDVQSARLLKELREWSTRQGVHLFDQGKGGIEHKVLVEEGFVTPGAVIVGADSHTCTHGALGAFGTGLGSTDIAACLALGAFWQSVPGTIRVELHGSKGRFVSGKDIILGVIGMLGVSGATNHVLEFVGAGATELTIDERLAVANMAVEAGAECGIFPADDRVADYLDGRARRAWSALASDADAEYAGELRLDLDQLEPRIAMPHSPGRVGSISEAAGTRVDQVYIGNCGNGTITDLRQAAEILRGHRVRDGCRALVVPASQRVYREALHEGLIEVFLEAGCLVSTPTCGACFGGGGGILAPNETALTTTNRNFRGRMGAPEARVYLANAWVCAAAAVAGEIVDPAAVAP